MCYCLKLLEETCKEYINKLKSILTGMWSEIMKVRGIMIDPYFTNLYTLIYSCILQKQLMEVFCKKVVLENFVKFYWKTPVLESLFNKVYKKRLEHRCFPVKFTKFLRAPILKNSCEWVKIAP